MHKGAQHWRNSQRRKEIERIDRKKAAESYDLARHGKTIDPDKDKTPDGYEWKGIE